ncbi:MAG: ATP-binding cassette domain-containing protein [Myxococcota bacterium]
MTLTVDITARAGALELEITLPELVGTTLIVGPNGAGKSSFLKTVLGILTPERGTIRLGERELFASESGVNVPIEERRIGYVPQSYALFPHMTARENVAFGSKSEERVDELMEHLDIARVADRKARVLSGGESQRVAIARALAPDPELLLLDEPMAALDQSARRRVRGFVARILDELRIPAIVVSHELEDVLALGAQTAVIERGSVAQAGTIDVLRAAPATDFIAEFFGQAPEAG